MGCAWPVPVDDRLRDSRLGPIDGSRVDIADLPGGSLPHRRPWKCAAAHLCFLALRALSRRLGLAAPDALDPVDGPVKRNDLIDSAGFCLGDEVCLGEIQAVGLINLERA
jgi:hypothetical protein